MGPPGIGKSATIVMSVRCLVVGLQQVVGYLPTRRSEEQR